MLFPEVAVLSSVPVLRSAVLLTLAGGLAACAGEPDPMLTDSVWVDDTSGPTDLRLAWTPVGADELNPHGDGSGVVELIATADGAIRYTFVVDGGARVDSETGKTTWTSPRQGTHDVDVTVTAFDADGASTALTETLTLYRSTSPFPTLAWADEFDVDGRPDPERWVHQVQPPQNGGWFNGELQHYVDRAENSYISDGTLKIVARREPWTIEGSRRDFTSARLNSTYAFTYGRVEVRAKLPPEGGTWPAIWTLGANIDELGNPFGDQYGSVGWPACGEIDILEQTGWDKRTTIAHFHWGDTLSGAYHNEGGYLSVPTSTTDFHVYALDWTESAMRIYVDDDLVYELANTEERPYDNPHYLLLNIAMGGNLGGSVPGDFDQATLEIDYVRVYR